MKYLALTLTVLCLHVLPSCSTGSVQQLEEMDDLEYSTWLRRVDSWSHVAAWALVEEEAVEAADLAMVADVIDSIAAGSIAEGAQSVLATALGDTHLWQVAAVQLLVVEADILLERRGVWGSPRTLEVLATVAAAIRRATVADPDPVQEAEAEVMDEELEDAEVVEE